MIPAQVWSEATIKSNTEACAGHRAIELEVPKETADAFETAGQYVQLTIGEEKPGFYAIASAPGKATFEFLIKENEGNAYLTSLKSGAPVKCSEVSGKGYQTKEHFDGDGGAVAEPERAAERAKKEAEKEESSMHAVLNYGYVLGRGSSSPWTDRTKRETARQLRRS